MISRILNFSVQQRWLVLFLLEALSDLLAGEVDVELLIEDGSDLRKAIAREGAGVLQPLDPGEVSSRPGR
jgi:hypothetical protein